MTRFRRTLTALSIPAVSAALLVAGASAASAAEGDTQFHNHNGTVRCDVVQTGDGPHVTCVSDGARATMPECAPPEELIPSVRGLVSGAATVGCWNQRLTGETKVLGAGQIGNAHGVTVIADPLSGLHVLTPSLTYFGYAGPTTVGTSPTAMSSQLSS